MLWIGFILLLSISTVNAQGTLTVSGTVVSADDQEPLPGVNILVKGTAKGTVTGIDGSYSLEANSSDVLVFSFVGFASQEVEVANRSQVDVQLQSDFTSLDEVVVVGYGTQQKSDITGSVGIVDAVEMKKFATSDVSQLMQGRVAGVQVNSDGQPGAAPNVRIRGYSTFGNAQPLYVIDGVPIGTSPRDFNPNDVESVQVLKDASAGAIYGSRAANGVIIITTKKGKQNMPLKISYSGYYGVDKVWQRIPVLGREDYQMIVNEVRTNANLPLLPGNDPSSPLFVDDVNTDWQEEGLKTGSRQNHNIGFTGGGEHMTYNVSLDYFSNKGTFVGNGPDYERYSARINTTTEKGIFKFGQSFYYAHSHENTLNYNNTVLTGSRPPLIVDLVESVPTMPIYDENNEGGFGGTEAEIHNVISLNGIGMNSLFKNYTDVDRILASGYGELQLIDKQKHKLKYKLNLSYDKTIAHDFSFIPAFRLGYFFSLNDAQLDEGNRTYTTGLVENTLNYNLYLGKHTFDILVGQMYQNNQFYDAFGHTEQLPKPYFPVLDNGTNKVSAGTKTEAVLSSYLGRVNYNYDERYLVTTTFRRDGSSRFSPDNRFGNFGSVAVGWRVSNEEFISLPEFVDNLKLRASYGQLGNQNIEDYLYSPYINSNIPYNFNGEKVVGGLQTSVVSDSIKWEVKTSSNIGFDLSMFNGKIDFSAEYYNSKTEDLLVGVPIPFSVGSVDFTPLVNAGSMRNHGFEFVLGYHENSGDWSFDVSANLTTLKNEVLSLGGNNEPIYGTGSKTEVGSEVGQHFGYEAIGIFQSEDEVANHAIQEAGTAPGDIIFKDQLTVDTDGDGIPDAPDGRIDQADRVFLGSAIPSLNYGLNLTVGYKNFDLTVFTSGASGFKINSRMYRDLMLTTDYINRHEDILDRWTPENTDADYPRVINGDPNINQRNSDRKGYLQDGKYLRINTVSIGYNLPDGVIKGITSARVYFTAQNLYTFQAYKGYNPDFTAEVFSPGFDFGSFPKPRTLMLGVQLSL
ncbi:TonB-dependent receptor [Fulvivirga maritima]|uniref:SusC/RagA family TonB-linked outer membrane protein n=1 Tax=Fulvivirga maritima TaxID=2904247 RepID=UPI001F1DBEE4|nr:TonB-dependent receptor [Fulvivirga maritima]UII27129.1 TonB-dependent receptor [Fulvivirga maritima]